MLRTEVKVLSVLSACSPAELYPSPPRIILDVIIQLIINTTLIASQSLFLSLMPILCELHCAQELGEATSVTLSLWNIYYACMHSTKKDNWTVDIFEYNHYDNLPAKNTEWGSKNLATSERGLGLTYVGLTPNFRCLRCYTWWLSLQAITFLSRSVSSSNDPFPLRR